VADVQNGIDQFSIRVTQAHLWKQSIALYNRVVSGLFLITPVLALAST
jgi:hypothetical protein